MKSKKILSVFAILSFVALAITPVFAGGDSYRSDLIAGQHNDVGSIKIYFDAFHDTMYIDINSDCPLVETHIWIGDDLSEIPRTKSGNPKIGHFDYNENFSETTYKFTEVIDISAYDGNPDTLYVLIHAVVDCPCGEQETAWGEGEHAALFSTRPDIFGNRWGYFLTIVA